MRSTLLTLFRKVEVPAYLFFIFIYPFLFISFGLDFGDSPYHYLTYAGFRPVSSYTFLSTVLGNGWMRIVGDSYISYRILAVMLTLVAHIIPVLVLIGSDFNLKEKLRYLALGIVFSSAISFNLLNYDIFSWLILSFIFVTGYLYVQKSKSWLIFILGVCLAIITAIRLPSIVVIIPILIIIIANETKNNSGILKTGLKIAILIVTAGVFYYLLRFIFYHNHTVTQIAKHSGDTLTLWEFLKEKTYYVIKLFPRYLSNGIVIFEMIGVILLITFIWNKFRLITSKIWIHYLFLISFLFAYFLFYVLRSNYNFNLSLFYSALTLFFIFNLLFIAIELKKSNLILILCFTAMIGFVAAIGSNTGLLKMAGVNTFVLPVILLLTIKSIPTRLKGGFYVLMSLLFFFSVTNKILVGKTYEDGRILQLNSAVDQMKLKGIKTSDDRKIQIEEILATIDSVRQTDAKSKFVFYGTTSHLFAYLSDSPQLVQLPFSMVFNDSLKAKALGHIISEGDLKPFVLLVFNYPEIDANMDAGLIGQQLESRSYSMFKSGNNYQFYGYKLKQN
jgi:hypothetical protein